MMTTLTIEVPEALSQQLHGSGLTPKQLETLIVRLIRLYIHQQEVRETLNLFEQMVEADAVPVFPKPRRQAGRAKHLNIKISDDFDEPLEDFAEYME